MEASQALEETRRLISAGHEQILRVTPDSFDRCSTEAFPVFRRGVVRAEGCREVSGVELLGHLDRKPQVIAFLARFADQKRGYRRQVENMLRILVKGKAWHDAALADLAARPFLPLDLHADADADELISVAPSVDAEPAASNDESQEGSLDMVMTKSRVRTVELVETGFAELVRLGLDSYGDEAISAFNRFSSGVTRVLERKIRADMAVVAALEPKAPFLAYLCRLHEKRRPYRSRVTSLLLALLETPALAAWRATADTDLELHHELEGLGVLDSGALGDEGSSSGEETEEARKSAAAGATVEAEEPGREAGEPAAEGAPGSAEDAAASARPRPSAADCDGGYRVMWMWRDSGRYMGRLSHALAKLNPVRWSNACSLPEAIAELRQFLDTPRGERPVKVQIFGKGDVMYRKTSNVAEAVVALEEILAAS